MAYLQIAQAIALPMAKCVEDQPQGAYLTFPYNKIHKSKWETIYENPYHSEVQVSIKVDFARQYRQRIISNGFDKTRRMALKVKSKDGSLSTHYYKMNPNFKCYLDFADTDKIVAVNRYKDASMAITGTSTTPVPTKNNRRCPPKASK